MWGSAAPLGGAECAVCLPLGGVEWQDRGTVRLEASGGALPDASSAATGPSRTTILDAIDTPDEVAHEIPSCRQSSFMSTSCISKTV